MKTIKVNWHHLSTQVSIKNAQNISNFFFKTLAMICKNYKWYSKSLLKAFAILRNLRKRYLQLHCMTFHQMQCGGNFTINGSLKNVNKHRAKKRLFISSEMQWLKRLNHCTTHFVIIVKFSGFFDYTCQLFFWLFIEWTLSFLVVCLNRRLLRGGKVGIPSLGLLDAWRSWGHL